MWQENFKYRAAVNTGFYFGDEDSEQTTSFTLEYGYMSEKVTFLAGVETGCATAIQPQVRVRDIPNEFLVYP